MSDKKISQLTGATTPLAGTEVLPVVQGGATVKVSVDNLTAGKNVKAATLSVGTNSTTGKVTINGDMQAQGAFGTLSGSLGVAIGAASGAISGNDMAVIAGDAYNNYKDLLIAPRNNGSDVGNTRFTSGDVVAVAGNLVIGTDGKGIDFTATPGTGTSELLADYEEGTWTPIVTAGVGSITSYTSSGRYTKIGRQVTATFIIAVTDNGTGASFLTVTGQPFTQLTNVALYGYNQSSGASMTGYLTGGTMYVFNSVGLYPVATGQTINCTITYFV